MLWWSWWKRYHLKPQSRLCFQGKESFFELEASSWECTLHQRLVWYCEIIHECTSNTTVPATTKLVDVPIRVQVPPNIEAKLKGINSYATRHKSLSTRTGSTGPQLPMKEWKQQTCMSYHPSITMKIVKSVLPERFLNTLLRNYN